MKSQASATIISHDATLDSILYGVSNTGGTFSYSIVGLRGFGKTSLLRDIEAILSEHTSLVEWARTHEWNEFPVTDIVPVYLDFGGWDGMNVLQRIAAAVTPILRKSVTGRVSQSNSHMRMVPQITSMVTIPDLTNLLDEAKKFLPRIVLLLDDFDIAYETISEEDEKVLRRWLPNMPAVIATQEAWAFLKRDKVIWSPLFRYVQDRKGLKPLSRDQAKVLLSQQTKPNALNLDDATMGFAYELSGGIPGLLLAVGRVLQEMHMVDKDVPSRQTNTKLYDLVVLRLLTDPRVNSLFTLWWEQLTSDEKQVLSELAVRDLASSRLRGNILERLRPWQLVREEGDSYRIVPTLFGDYIRLLSRPAATRRGGGTVDDRLLTYLREHPNVLIPYEQLVIEIWGDESTEGRRVDNAVSRLRKRLGRNAIETIYGKGIRYNSADGDIEFPDSHRTN